MANASQFVADRTSYLPASHPNELAGVTTLHAHDRTNTMSLIEQDPFPTKCCLPD